MPPAPSLSTVVPGASLVRPYVLAEERRRDRYRADRTRLGVAVPLGIGDREAVAA